MISERSNYSGAVSCLVFDDTPHYKFEVQLHKMHMAGDGLLGSYVFTPIWVENVRIKGGMMQKGLDDLEEIDPELFDSELDKLVPRIKEMEWGAEGFHGSLLEEYLI